ncbi:endolytic transglycosylase MltG [Granulicella tundricola]|uniref:Endolytic murein transglycosylase n=1 Tax=Granulicella tundricola (strain ATCC BAA-1859 / DSM 23138 / MP5ACTX9) TaxID=1198114 RepID=E8WVW6_GRATM|nr:endolytic transglycosylase MltG [Granulicella tundricola]ADW70725.1 aminodeoxychorismate lyase [Granulicella tundricola MP5ACTX9]
MRLVRLLFLLILVGAAAFVFLVPFGPHTETFVDIPSGTGTQGMAARLKRGGVIRSAFAFEALRALRGGRLKAGEYRFDHPAPLNEIYARIAKGDVYTIQVTIPEGYNIFDIAQTIQGAKLAEADAFLAAERRDTGLIRDLSPQAASLEGYLFPDTYRFSRHTTPDQMVATMVKRFRQVTAGLGLAPGPDTARTVTMASLIEKEVRVDSERPLVAGVFVNRLAQGMPLATDPTVAYAALLDGRWRGTIYQSDLASDSPYNTYRHAGLPPGPIANPGVAAFKAALQPAKTDFLYFVADAQGHSLFSRTLKEHNERVQAYRLAEKAAHPQ